MIECDSCMEWFHIYECLSMSREQHNEYQDTTKKFYCSVCEPELERSFICDLPFSNEASLRDHCITWNEDDFDESTERTLRLPLPNSLVNFLPP